MTTLKQFFSSLISKVSTPLPAGRGWGVGLLLLFILASCGPDSKHGRVKGNIDGVNQANISAILAFVDDSLAGTTGNADSIKVKRGSFTYDREITRPTILTLLYPNYSTTSLVIEPGKTVRLKGAANSLNEIEVDGNEDNNLLTEFRKRTLGKREAEVQREAETFIRTHASTTAAVLLFRDVFANAEVLKSNPTESLLKDLQKAQPHSPSVQKLTSRITPLLATAPGKTMPPFSGTDVNGNAVSSASYAGSNLLIVFCAQWDASFFTIKRNARELNANVPTGKLSFLFVSLDAEKNNIISANSFDPLPGKILFDGKALSSPLVDKLGMRYISGSILVGPDGKVKARDIPVRKWVEQIPALL